MLHHCQISCKNKDQAVSNSCRRWSLNTTKAGESSAGVNVLWVITVAVPQNGNKGCRAAGGTVLSEIHKGRYHFSCVKITCCFPFDLNTTVYWTVCQTVQKSNLHGKYTFVQHYTIRPWSCKPLSLGMWVVPLISLGLHICLKLSTSLRIFRIIAH